MRRPERTLAGVHPFEKRYFFHKALFSFVLQRDVDSFGVHRKQSDQARKEMRLSLGAQYLAIPGPSAMPERVLRAMHRGTQNIYEGALLEVTETLVPDLKSIARTNGHLAMYISNGHGMWEAAVVNVTNPGDKIINIAVGHFGRQWGNTARAMGREVVDVDFGSYSAIDPARVAAALEAHPEARAVMMTHVDTSSGRVSDVQEVSRLMRGQNHKALLMVDCMASLGCDRYEMDAWGVDVTMTGSQKGLMTPAGLGFLFYTDRAAAQRDTLEHVSPYWDWAPRSGAESLYRRFCGTTPAQHVYALREALDMLGEEGLENVWARHKCMAGAVHSAVEHWSKAEGGMRFVTQNPSERSNATTSVEMPAPLAKKLRAVCEEKLGVTLGIGLGIVPPDDPLIHGHFRIGHMGHLNGHMILGALAVIEAGLVACDIPHQSGGVSAASAALAQTL